MENPIAIDRTTSRVTSPTFEERLERIRLQRDALRLRHSQALARLMEEREDLRGVHALADFVDDSLRWSA
ncbi:hypothetical protein [Nocardioides abyssi]|uniref:Uncharacterized protein n=1 Tax=Nocardioides abyssi TaxID=3058370 RepID=A0ABT8ET96_9ACTN|nr:hypothetical protein [Nocardioides abyssi]MDN4161370.1 hypothetical protein [Nocardioides abyssi]